ncbi:hypothetical protein [Lysinibacillus contaminans]|nr:hypothetical protein [Lysinibacillus contaminans]
MKNGLTTMVFILICFVFILGSGLYIKKTNEKEQLVISEVRA